MNLLQWFYTDWTWLITLIVVALVALAIWCLSHSDDGGGTFTEALLDAIFWDSF
jgi:hypothetical protein